MNDLEALLERTSAGPWEHDSSERCGSRGDWGVSQVESGEPICWVGDPYPRGDNHPYENMVLISLLPDLARLCIQQHEALEQIVCLCNRPDCLSHGGQEALAAYEALEEKLP